MARKLAALVQCAFADFAGMQAVIASLPVKAGVANASNAAGIRNAVGQEFGHSIRVDNRAAVSP